MVGCKSCELIERRNAGNAPVWDDVLRAKYWDVAHALGTSLSGWLVLICRRHIGALHELTEEEAVELGQLQRQLSIALREVTGCHKTYIMQFAEHPDHPHVHFHIVPRMAEQPKDDRSAGILRRLNAPPDQRLTDEDKTIIALELQKVLAKL